jgi:CxxC-x17-CxxC domain-containing protein
MPDFKKQNFKRDNQRGSGGPSRSFGSRERGPRELFPAVCGTCKNNCQVPFAPSSDKPVLCDNCFSSSRQQQSRFDRPQAGGNRSFNKPQRSSFTSRENVSSTTESASFYFEKVKKQLDVLTHKVDMLLSSLNVPHVSSGKPDLSDSLKDLIKNVRDEAEDVIEDIAEVASDAKEKIKKVVAKKEPKKVVTKKTTTTKKATEKSTKKVSKKK